MKRQTIAAVVIALWFSCQALAATITVTNVAGLSSARVGDGDLVQTAGYTTAGDGGGNLYRYSASSSATVDGGWVINGPGGAGRYLAVNQTELNVYQWGLTGSGDEGAALQALLTVASGKQKPVVIPFGTITSSQNLVFATNCHLRGTLGSGRSFNSRLQLNDARILFHGTDGAGTGNSFQNSITDLRITFSDATPPTEVIYHGTGYWNTLRNVVMFDCSRDQLITIAGGNHFLMDNVVLDGNDTNASQDGISIQGGWTVINNPSIQQCKENGIHYLGGTATVTGAYIENCLAGIRFDNGATWDKLTGERLTVTGGTIRQRNAGMCLRFQNCNNILVDGVALEWDQNSGIDAYNNWVYATSRCQNVKVRGIDRDKFIRHDTGVAAGNIQHIEIELEEFFAADLVDGDATPSVLLRGRVNTSNSGATTITNFDDGIDGQQLVVIFGDVDTTVQHNANITLNGAADFTPAVIGSAVHFVRSDGVWREVGRSVPGSGGGGQGQPMAKRNVADGDTAPSATDVSLLVFANTAPTTVTSFAGGQVGQRLTVFSTNGNTTIDDGTSIVCESNADVVMTATTTAEFIFDGSQWIQTVGLLGH